jgi:Kef-type K+ transport system membrane component KefB
MLAATAGGLDLDRLLLDLLIILAAAKLGAEIAERIGVPAVLGEIILGVVVGSSVLGLVELNGDRGVSIEMMAEIGVLLLLLSVGMEMDLGELRRVGGTALTVAVIGVAAPFAAGYSVGKAFGESNNTALFFGAALTATSVGITARVLGDLRVLGSREAKIVLGAAVADDVLGLAILTVVVKVVTGDDVGLSTVAETLGLATLFLVATGSVGVFVIPKLFQWIHRRARSDATLIGAAFVLMIGFAVLASEAKLAFIIGAFMAGLGLGRSAQHERIADDLASISHLFVPVFFVSVGIKADLDAMLQPSVLALAGTMTVVAIAGKLASGLGALRSRADGLLIGVGMIPRGEVGLIFAAIGLNAGVLGDKEYGALLFVVLLTTLLAPPALRWRVNRLGPATPQLAPSADGVADRASDADGDTLGETDPALCLTSTGTVSFCARPNRDAAIGVAFAAAHASTSRAIDPDVMAWFADQSGTRLTWDRAHTPLLAASLRRHDTRELRVLEESAVLERALPELARAMYRRRADDADLDWRGGMRFPSVNRLIEFDGRRTVGGDGGEQRSDELLLAAFVADVCVDHQAVDALSRRLYGTDGERISRLIRQSEALSAAARTAQALDDDQLRDLTARFRTADQLLDAHDLAVAIGVGSVASERRLDDLVDQLALIVAA